MASKKKTAPKKTVQELLAEAEQQSLDAAQRITDLKQQRLAELASQKKELESQLLAITSEMAELDDKPAKKTRKTRKPRATKEDTASLLNAIQDALKGTDGMKVKDVITKIQASGYVVTSENFYSSVATLLGKNEEYFVKVDRGVYKLKG